MKKVLHIVIWSALIFGLVVLLGFTKVRHNHRQVHDVVVNISYDEQRKSDILITYEDIDHYLARNFDSLTHQALGEVDVNAIENSVREMDYVNEAEAFMNIEGKLFLNLSQRRPIIRVMLQNGENIYLDEKGKVMPVRLKHPSKLIICNGYVGMKKWIPEKDSIELRPEEEHLLLAPKLKDIYTLAKALDQNEFLSTLITQVYVNDRSEFELIPLLGDQTIILGNVSRLDEKLMYLETFYRQETAKNGWTQYKSINLKFKNQVVCTKK